jgi:hypothetical protein
MRLADIDLRHSAAAGPLHHFIAALGLQVDPHLLDVRDALARQQLLGAYAVGTDGGRIHQNLGHVGSVIRTFL